MKYDIITVDKWEAPPENGPALLCMPNVPKPLHLINPRNIMGEYQWGKVRKQIREEQNYICQASGELLGTDRGAVHCLPKGTEVLSSKGWIKIEDVTTEHLVAQFVPTNETIEFINPTATMSKFEESLTQIGYSRGLKIQSTHDHRTLVFKWTYGKKVGRKSVKTVKAQDAPTGLYWNIWTAGYGKGDSYLTDAERVFIALQANGSLCYRRKTDGMYVYSLRVSKKRKKEQLRDLMSKYPFTHYEFKEKNRPEYLCYKIESPSNCKNFWECFSIEDMSGLKAKQFVDELVKWDGWEGYRDNCKGRCYYTTEKTNKEFVQAVATLAGLDTHITIGKHLHRHPTVNHQFYKECFNIEFHKNNYRGMQTMVKRTIPYNDMVYCITVPSHYFVARQNGDVFITGNCHEIYTIDWTKHTSTFERAVCLDPLLHTTFIHSGRALTLFKKNDPLMPMDKMLKGLEKGFKLISDWNRNHCDDEPLRVYSAILEWAKEPRLEHRVNQLIKKYKIKFYDFDESSINKYNWSKWRLLYNGKEYPPKFANQQEWEEHFSKSPVGKPVEKVEGESLSMLDAILKEQE